jgi:hypothetical protein
MRIRRTAFLTIGLIVGGAGVVNAQTVTAWLARETGRGFGKQCIYTYGGTTYSRSPRQTDRTGLNQRGVVEARCDASIEVKAPKLPATEMKPAPDTQTVAPTDSGIYVGEREMPMLRECQYVSRADSTVKFKRVVPLKAQCASLVPMRSP